MAVIMIHRTFDLATIVRLNREIFGRREPLDANYSQHWWWLGTHGSQPTAFAGMSLLQHESAVFLSRAGVLPDYRGEGLQRRLIRARLRAARKLGMHKAITYTSRTNVVSANNLIRTGFQLYIPAHYWITSTVLYWMCDL